MLRASDPLAAALPLRWAAAQWATDDAVRIPARGGRVELRCRPHGTPIEWLAGGGA